MLSFNPLRHFLLVIKIIVLNDYRVGWTDDGLFVWLQILDRSQQRLELVLIPETQFVRSSLPKIGSGYESNGPDSNSSEIEPIQVQTS